MSILDLFRKKEENKQQEEINKDQSLFNKNDNNSNLFGFDESEENQQKQTINTFDSSTKSGFSTTNMFSSQPFTTFESTQEKVIDENEEELMKTDVKDGNVENTCLFSHFDIDNVQGWKSFVHTEESDNQWQNMYPNISRDVKRFQQHSNK